MDVSEQHSSPARNNNRRLSVAQMEALEMSFQVEKKLQPQRKLQLAQLLGLQPRQIAVWFQNRRARWKTKQLEKDFHLLNHNYRLLKANYDALLQEIQNLQSEARRLRSLESGNCTQDLPSEPSSPLRTLPKASSEATVDISDDGTPTLADERHRAVLDGEQDCLWSHALWQEISD